MKTRNFKQAFAKTVLSLESLKWFWSYFPELYKSEDAEKALLNANARKFTDNIFDFYPVLTPFTDYDIEIGKFKVTEKNFKVDINDIIPDEQKDTSNSTGFIHYSNGVKQKTKPDIEYFRLFIIHIMTKPVVKDKPPFMISKVISDPKRFDLNKQYRFILPIPNELNREYDSYKYHRTLAFCVNFHSENDVNENGVTETFEHIFSASEVHLLNAMLIEDSDIDVKLPKHFDK